MAHMQRRQRSRAIATRTLRSSRVRATAQAEDAPAPAVRAHSALPAAPLASAEGTERPSARAPARRYDSGPKRCASMLCDEKPSAMSAERMSSRSGSEALTSSSASGTAPPSGRPAKRSGRSKRRRSSCVRRRPGRGERREEIEKSSPPKPGSGPCAAESASLVSDSARGSTCT